MNLIIASFNLLLSETEAEYGHGVYPESPMAEP
jgi:hypothetical protein